MTKEQLNQLGKTLWDIADQAFLKELGLSLI